MKNSKPTFKKFVAMIAEAPDKETAIQTIFYGWDGIDMAYQRGFITYNDSELLLRLIEKMA